MHPIEMDGVWKSYGRAPAVRNLSLRVPSRSVYGFLGPNGAGKSTTIRMILRLQRPDRGVIRLFGTPIDKAGTELFRRVGALVESPSLYPHLTGRENLEVHRRLLDIPKTTIDEALLAVDLMGPANRLVRTYSSGMKQRLGIAQALLGNPELLLLDEPTNGLDPAGIHEVRSLIRELPERRGVTVFLSSHLLAEVEQVATHVAILSLGQLKFEGTAAQLRERSRPLIVVTVDDTRRALEVLADRGIDAASSGDDVQVAAGSHQAAEINLLLVRAGIAVSALGVKYPTLEDSFLELTSQSEAVVVL